MGGATQIVQMFIIPVFFYIEKPGISNNKKVMAFLLMVFLVFIGIYNLLIFIVQIVKDVFKVEHELN